MRIEKVDLRIQFSLPAAGRVLKPRLRREYPPS
jgi:hypothetical protein